MRTYEDQVDYYKKNKEMCDWCHVRYRDFWLAACSEIKSEIYLDDFALALAWASYTEGKDNLGQFMTDWGLDDIDALCYLHRKTGAYETEVEEAFDAYLLDLQMNNDNY